MDNPDKSQQAKTDVDIDRLSKTHENLKLFSTKGRLNRLSYLSWCVVYMFIAGLLTSPLSFITIFYPSGIFPSEIISAGFYLFKIIPDAFSLTFATMLIGFAAPRRLHDLGRSGHWAWLFVLGIIELNDLIDLICLIVTISLAIYLLIARGQPGSNDYGAPRPSPQIEQVFGKVIGALLTLWVCVLALSVYL